MSVLNQRLQRTREFSKEECLVQTPGRTADVDQTGASVSRTPRRTPGRAATPRRTPRNGSTPGRTPVSRGQRTPDAGVRGVKAGGGRRHLVRMAALRSPYASPNTQSQRLWVLKSSPAASSSFLSFRGWFISCFIFFFVWKRKFDQDLESVSSGLRRLKHLSKVFDDLIGRDDG